MGKCKILYVRLLGLIRTLILNAVSQRSFVKNRVKKRILYDHKTRLNCFIVFCHPVSVAYGHILLWKTDFPNLTNQKYLCDTKFKNIVYSLFIKKQRSTDHYHQRNVINKWRNYCIRYKNTILHFWCFSWLFSHLDNVFQLIILFNCHIYFF